MTRSLRRGASRSSRAPLRSGIILCAVVFCCTRRLWSPSAAPPTAAVISESELKSEATAGVRGFMQHVGRWPERLEERFLGPINFDRATLRIDAMDTYALCSAVMLQVVVGMYGATQDGPDDEESNDPDEKTKKKIRQVTFEAQMLLLMICVLCTCFTMVMFLLNKVYSSTAIGMWKDVAYFNFQYHTAQQRKYAFWSLITAVISFMFSFSISIYDRYGGIKGALFVVTSVVIGLIMCQSAKEMMDLANKHVFESYPY